MPTRSSPLLPILLGLLAAVCPGGVARAGSAVATDHHGGFGYAYGSGTDGELRRQALARCREQSRHPEQAEVIVSTASPGWGVIVRYRVDGEQHVYAYVGADSFEQARRRAEGGARRRGADEPEVVARWEDR